MSIQDTLVRERLGSAVLGLTHLTLVRENQIFDFSDYDKVPVEEHTPEQSETHERIGELMGHVGEYLGAAHGVVEDRKRQESPDEWDADVDPRYDIFETAKEAACEVALGMHRTGDTEGAKKAIEAMVAVSIIGKSKEEGVAPQIRRMVADGMAGEVVGALQGMHGVIALKNDGAVVQSAAYECRKTVKLLSVASEMTFDEQFQHVQPLHKLPDIDKSNLMEEAAKELAPADFGALATLENYIHHNPDKATEYSTRAINQLIAQGGHSASAVDVARIIADGHDFALSSQQQTHEKFNDAAAALCNERAAGEKQAYRNNYSLSLTLDESMVLLAKSGNRDGVLMLVSSCPRDAISSKELGDNSHADDAITWPMTRLGLTEDVQRQVRDLIAGCSAEKRSELQELLRDNGASEESIKLSIDTVHSPDAMATITKEFWAVYETEDNAEVKSLLFGENRHNQPKRTEDILSLISAGVQFKEITTLMVPRMAYLNTEQKSAYLKQVSELMKVIRADESTRELGNESTVNLTTLLGYSQPADLMKYASQLYDDHSVQRLTNLGSLLSGKESWRVNDFISFDAIKLEKLDYALANGLQPICTDNSGAAVDAIVRYVTSSEGHDGTSALDIVVQLNQNGLFSFTGDHVQDEIIIKATLGAPNPLNHFELLGKLKDAGLFEFGSDIQNQVLRFVLNQSNPEEALQLTQGLYKLNGFLRDARRRYEKKADNSTNKDDNVTEEFSLNIPFMSHPREWFALLDQIPDGKPGEVLRGKILDRLFLPHRMANLPQGAFEYKEDPIQEMRIFSEMIPTSEDVIREQFTPFETDLFRRLVAAGPDFAIRGERGDIEGYRGFPSKPSKLKYFFFDEKSVELYSQLYKAKLGGEETLQQFLGDHPNLAEEPLMDRGVTDLLGHLRILTEYYRKEPGGAENWFNQYAAEPVKAIRLISAWQSRALALTYRNPDDPTYRIDDNPNAILDFVAFNGVQILAESKIATGTTTLTREDVRGFRGWIESIGSRYAASVTIAALEKAAQYKKEHGPYPPKIIKQGQSSVVINDWTTVAENAEGKSETKLESREFSTAILSPDDPGGFTIGYDTGCCMTLDGASENCIWAGYEDPRYSFFTVRDGGGRLRAQSILYIVEEMGKKYLVVDNIEVNGGTDVTQVAKIYKQALLDILKKNEIEVDAIHIGQGFVEEGILDNLPLASVTPQTPRPGTYSDASIQRVLWSKE